MAGHSKWATTKRKKAVIDQKRAKVFTKLLREIQVAAKMGGGNPDGNPRLKTAILAAKAVSVPNDNIERAMKRGSGESDTEAYEEITYEGYGPGGVALMVRALTDNRNRTASEVRHAFSRSNGSLGGQNCVAFMFQERGVLTLPKSAIAEEELLEASLDAGASDMSDDGENWVITSEPRDFDGVRTALEKLKLNAEGAVRLLPVSTTRVSGADAENLLKLMEMLDDLDDVQDVVANFEMDDQEMERLSK